MARTAAQLIAQFVRRKAMVRVLDYPACKSVRARGRNAAVGMLVPVMITDARNVYGRDQVLVQPLRGEGTAWIQLDRVPARLMVVDDWPEDQDASQAGEHDPFA